MNKFLKSAVTRYEALKGTKDYLINPISTVDAEIMIELGQILKKLGAKDLFEILNSYKEVKDAEIRDTLIEWNIQHPSGGNKDALSKVFDRVFNKIETEEKEEEKYPPFIRISNLTMRIYDLKGLELTERVDDEGNYKWGIVINPTPDHVKQIPLYSNYRVEFFSEKNRNDVLKKLESVFSENGTDFIEIKENE